MTDNIQPIPASHENGQAELVEAIIELNNMGDDWDAQHIGELIADWHNKQTEALLNEMLVDVSSPSATIDQAEMIELINLYINKLKEES